MRKAIKLRTLTTEEETEVRRLAASRKEPHRLVQRQIASLFSEKTTKYERQI
jgi:hypothetical protein